MTESVIVGMKSWGFAWVLNVSPVYVIKLGDVLGKMTFLGQLKLDGCKKGEA